VLGISNPHFEPSTLSEPKTPYRSTGRAHRRIDVKARLAHRRIVDGRLAGRCSVVKALLYTAAGAESVQSCYRRLIRELLSVKAE
jgi:hypothetical protein